jgi:hypothetical protein
VHGGGDLAGRHPTAVDQPTRQVRGVREEPAESERPPGGAVPDLVQAVTGRNDEITRRVQRAANLLLERPVRFRHNSRSTVP